MDIEDAKDGLKILTEPSEGGLTRLFSQKGIDAIEQLKAENAKLKSDLEEARKDAERLDWVDKQVRKMTNVVIQPYSMDKCIVILRLFGHNAKDCAPSDDTRAAIDAARQQQG